MEWPPWELRVDARHGRGLWATARVAEGATLLLAHVYSAGVGAGSCAHCLADLGVGVRCSSCSLRYCGQKCSDADPHSAHACEMLRRLASCPDWDTPLVRHLVRLVCALDGAADGGDSPAHGDGDLPSIAARLRARPTCSELRPPDVLALDACRASMPTARYNEVVATRSFVHRLFRRTKGAEPSVDIAGALCRIMHNGFGVRDACGKEVGCALLPTASMFNHSCEPSCKLRHPLGGSSGGRSLEFVAARAIAAGEQLTISYVDAALPREERRARLAESYYFDCACARCTRMQ